MLQPIEMPLSSGTERRFGCRIWKKARASESWRSRPKEPARTRENSSLLPCLVWRAGRDAAIGARNVSLEIPLVVSASNHRFERPLLGLSLHVECSSVFVKVAQTKYSMGKVADGDFSRKNAATAKH